MTRGAGGFLAAGIMALAPASFPSAAAAATGPTPVPAVPAAGKATAGHARTVVSLTFDDGDADQMTAARILASHRMNGTFYIIAGAVGDPHYFTLSDLHQLADAGNEIGGHTVSHLDLAGIPAAEARRQVAGSRDILTGWGFRVTSFAYPSSYYSPAVERTVERSGYSSARIVGGLRNPASSACDSCSPAETIPPANPYAIRTPGSVDRTWTLASLERAVTDAERSGGGWVPLVFHQVYPGKAYGVYSVSAPTLNAFVTWLAQRADAGTTVETVNQVIGGHLRPLPQVAAALPHGIVNPSLESSGAPALAGPSGLTGTATVPTGWMEDDYGDNTVSWARTHDAHSGRWALRLSVSRYVSGSAELIQQFDLGSWSLPVTIGKAYQVSAWYKSTTGTAFSIYYRDQEGRWRYWTTSPRLDASPSWKHAVWQTPPVPVSATGVSFGLVLDSNGILITDDYGFTTAPPSDTLTILLLVIFGVYGGSAAAAGFWQAGVRRRNGGPADAGGRQPPDGRPPFPSGQSRQPDGSPPQPAHSRPAAR